MESAVHTYTVEVLRQFFMKNGIKPKRWISVGGDLVICQKKFRRKLAVEVETGNAYRIAKPELIRKFKSMRKRYHVIIVLTNSAYLKRYRKLFPDILVILRKDVIPFFSKKMSSLGFSSFYKKSGHRSQKISSNAMARVLWENYDQLGLADSGMDKASTVNHIAHSKRWW